MKLLFKALLCAATLCVAQAAFAQSYPSRPVHLIVAYAPGGTGDVVARLLSDKLAAVLGQSIVVENRGGGDQTSSGARNRGEEFLTFGLGEKNGSEGGSIDNHLELAGLD